MPRYVYSIMADCGVGEFLWRKQTDEQWLVGGNYFCMLDRADDQDLISEGLFNKLRDWAKEFMDGQPTEWGDPWQVDWDRFNARGLDLARWLKEELGDDADVQYVRAGEDPGEDRLLLYLGTGRDE